MTFPLLARLRNPDAGRGVLGVLVAVLRTRFVWFTLLALAFELWIFRTVRARAGGPSAPLDDVFIHFQYARSIAELHPFRYGALTAAPTSGATSVLYPFLLAGAYLVGFRGTSLLIAAHLFGALGWAASAEGMYQLGRRVWSPLLGAVAAAMMFLCAGFVWVAGSGMETIFAVAVVVWTFALTFSLDETGEAHTARALAVVGALAPFVRTELSAMSVMAAGAILLRAPGRSRRLALAPLAAIPGILLFWKLVTGSSRTSGSVAKWIFYDPYNTRTQILDHIGRALRGIFTEVLAGKGWSERYFPADLRWLAVIGFVLVVGRALRKRRWVSALAWLGALLAIAIPTTFAYWEVHRYRYLWPFFALPVACMLLVPVAIGQLVARVRGAAEDKGVGAVLAGIMLGLFAGRVPAVVDDLAECGSAIRHQQIKLAQQHVARLPPNARVLINDAGALAYFGGHETVDFVGLTTMGFAAAYVSGPGSVFEALESLPASQRPTHGALYRWWLQADGILGPVLARATVEQHSILGGNTMELATLRTELFGTGAQPLTPLAAGERIADEVDVADLTSEAAHGYENDEDRQSDNLVREYLVPGRGPVAEGGRVVPRREALTLRGTPGRAGRVLLRTDAWFPVTVRIEWNGTVLEPARRIEAAHRFVDVAIEVPAEQARAENRLQISLVQGANYGSFHYFYVQR